MLLKVNSSIVVLLPFVRSSEHYEINAVIIGKVEIENGIGIEMGCGGKEAVRSLTLPSRNKFKFNYIGPNISYYFPINSSLQD